MLLFMPINYKKYSVLVTDLQINNLFATYTNKII
jgi:hypothetical protein